MQFNRFIALVKPYINLFAAAIAAWLIAKSNVLGIPGLGEHGDELTTGIAAALTWIVTQVATQLGDQTWLKGHHLQIVADGEVQAAALQAAAAAPSAMPTLGEHEDSLELDEQDLPDDETEFAAPPPEDSNMPVQPTQSGVDRLAA